MKFVAATAVLLVIWYILSGKLDLLHFGTGVITALVIAAFLRGRKDDTRFRPGAFLLYVPWLVWQVLLSNLRVARMVLSPRMPIRPVFISQAPGVSGVRALTTLGTSVTLTPGTLTIDVGEDEIFVHALDARSASDTRDGVVASQVVRVFRPGA